MGIINNDLFELSNGVQKVGTYISFNNETIYLRRNNTSPTLYPTITNNSNYVINANYRIYWDKSAKNSGKNFMESRFISVVLTEQELNVNPYVALYNKLKEIFPNVVDDFEPDSSNESNLSSGSQGSSSPPLSQVSYTGPSGTTDLPLSQVGYTGPSGTMESPLNQVESSGPSGSSS
jgi:hypothetical protein